MSLAAAQGAAWTEISGGVLRIVPGQGLWKSSDRGRSFARVDGGETWKRVAPLPERFTRPRPGRFANVDRDPARGLFHASPMGKGIFKLKTR